MQIDPAAIRAGVRLEACDTLGSTNDEALARARAGMRGPLWITAQRQTAGRGRQARVWVSEPGNLYATLLLTDPSPAQHAAELSLVAALALQDALADIAPTLAPRLLLKWPNDVLVDGAKVAGILIEGENRPPLAVAIGIGVNCAHHPAGTPYPAIDLAAAGFRTTPDRLLCVLSRTMLDRTTQWARGNAFAAIRADWLARAAGPGTDIRVALGEQELQGRFDGIDAAGHLVLRLADGTARTIAAGDVIPLGTPNEACDVAVARRPPAPKTAKLA